MDAGINSLDAIRLASQLGTLAGVEFSPTLIFDGGTPRGVVHILLLQSQPTPIPEAGRYYGKGMRIDHLLVSELLLQPRDGQSAWRVKRAAIHGHGFMREGFFGSDHCPMVLELERTPTPTQK